MLTEAQVSDTSPGQGQGAAQRPSLWLAHRYALRRDLRAHGGGHHSQGEPWTLHQHQAQCGALAEVQGRRAGGALHGVLENLLDMALPTSGRLFPQLTVDRVVKRYAYLRRRHPELRGTVFHSTRKWFITQCERTGVPEHFTASLVGHHSARSANKLTYGLYSAGISDAQKREIVDGIRLPDWESAS